MVILKKRKVKGKKMSSIYAFPHVLWGDQIADGANVATERFQRESGRNVTILTSLFLPPDEL